MVKHVWKFDGLLVEVYRGPLPEETVILTIIWENRNLSTVLALDETLELFRTLAVITINRLIKVREKASRAYKKAHEKTKHDEKRLQEAKEKGWAVEDFESALRKSINELTRADIKLKVVNEQLDILEKVAEMPVKYVEEVECDV